MRLTRDFYTKDVVKVAKSMLGKVLCINHDGKITRVRIVETESYGGITDKAAHSYQGRMTERTKVLFEVGGYVYVYLIYGMYYLLNFVANKKDIPEGVLIRAVEPLEPQSKILTNGPGKLTKHLGIDFSFYGEDAVTSQRIYLEDDGYEAVDIVESKRINIDYAMEDKERLWRFYIKDNNFVSRI